MWVAVVVVVVLLALVFFWWFRRTPLYRANRRYGTVPGGVSWTSAISHYGQRTDAPLLRPELRPEDDQVPRHSRPWWRWRSKQPR